MTAQNSCVVIVETYSDFQRNLTRLFSSFILSVTSKFPFLTQMTAKEKENIPEKSLRLVRYLSDNPDWSEYDDDQELFVQEFPKIELHVHLDGSFDPLFLWKYMQKHPESMLCLPTETVPPWQPTRKLEIRKLVEDCTTSQEYHKLCTCRGYRSLQEMLNCFEMFLPLVRRNLDLLEQLAYDFCQRQWEQNVVYTEVRYSPFLLAESFEVENKNSQSVDAEAVFAAITSGLRRGSHKFGIIVNQIISAITWRPDWAMPSLELAQKHREDYPCATLGIDIAAGEEHFDRDQHSALYEPHFAMIQKAKEYKLPVTLHAGEAAMESSMDNVRRAIDVYGASRIGHGYRTVNDLDLINYVKEKKIHFEVCPTSSDETGGWMYKEEKNWKEHPCLAMLKHGIPFSLNSDDPAVFHTSLSWQYQIALAKMDLTREDIVKCNLQAIDAAFCSEERKVALRKSVHCYGKAKNVDIDWLECGCDDHERVTWRRSRSESYIDKGFVDRVYVHRSGLEADYL